MRRGDDTGVRDHRHRGIVAGQHHGAAPHLAEGRRRCRGDLRPR